MTDSDGTGNKKFAILLKKHRKAKDFTQESLASKAGLSTIYVSSLESGQRDRPSLQTIINIVQALGLGEDTAEEMLQAAGHTPASYGSALNSAALKSVVQSYAETKPESFRRALNRRLEIIAHQQSDSEFDLGIWEPQIVCGFGGASHSSLAVHVARSLLIGSEPVPWRELPLRIDPNDLAFGIHNATALLSADAPLVFCCPPLYSIQGTAIFISKELLEKRSRGARGIAENPLHELSDERKSYLLNGSKIAVEAGTDLEVALFKVLKQLGLDYKKDVVLKDMDSDEGNKALATNEVHACCTGLNHSYALERLGFVPLFRPDQIDLKVVNGIVTTQSFYEEHKSLLQLFVLMWFRIVSLIKTKLQETRSEYFIDLMVRDLNHNVRAPLSVRDFRASFELLTPYDHSSQASLADLDNYLDELNSFSKASGHGERFLNVENKLSFPRLF